MNMGSFTRGLHSVEEVSNAGVRMGLGIEGSTSNTTSSKEEASTSDNKSNSPVG